MPLLPTTPRPPPFVPHGGEGRVRPNGSDKSSCLLVVPGAQRGAGVGVRWGAWGGQVVGVMTDPLAGRVGPSPLCPTSRPAAAPGRSANVSVARRLPVGGASRVAAASAPHHHRPGRRGCADAPCGTAVPASPPVNPSPRTRLSPGCASDVECLGCHPIRAVVGL